MNPTISLVTEVEVAIKVAAMAAGNNRRDRSDGPSVMVEIRGSVELDIM